MDVRIRSLVSESVFTASPGTVLSTVLSIVGELIVHQHPGQQLLVTSGAPEIW